MQATFENRLTKIRQLLLVQWIAVSIHQKMIIISWSPSMLSMEACDSFSLLTSLDDSRGFQHCCSHLFQLSQVLYLPAPSSSSRRRSSRRRSTFGSHIILQQRRRQRAPLMGGRLFLALHRESSVVILTVE